MQMTFIMFIIILPVFLGITGAAVYLFLLIVKALKSYISSQDV